MGLANKKIRGRDAIGHANVRVLFFFSENNLRELGAPKVNGRENRKNLRLSSC
jgi:hypothetical protein